MVMSKRAAALIWWRKLSIEEQRELVEKHFKGISFVQISTSSFNIELMFKKENK